VASLTAACVASLIFGVEINGTENHLDDAVAKPPKESTYERRPGAATWPQPEWASHSAQCLLRSIPSRTCKTLIPHGAVG